MSGSNQLLRGFLAVFLGNFFRGKGFSFMAFTMENQCLLSCVLSLLLFYSVYIGLGDLLASKFGLNHTISYCFTLMSLELTWDFRMYFEMEFACFQIVFIVLLSLSL